MKDHHHHHHFMSTVEKNSSSNYDKFLWLQCPQFPTLHPSTRHRGGAAIGNLDESRGVQLGGELRRAAFSRVP
jgi:hypothetical protein